MKNNLYYFCFLFLIQLLWPTQSALPQDTLIVFPYRYPEILSTDDNGFTSNGEHLYISHLFDGHIYEFNFREKTLIDRFRIRKDDSNLNSAGALIFDKYSAKIYAASSTSLVRIPKIYIFDSQSDTLPQAEISVDTLGLYSFYSPVSDDKFVYWGCYHTQTNSAPRIVRLNKSNLDVDIMPFYSDQHNLLGNYTRSLCYLNEKIFVSTEVGAILVYNSRTQKYEDNLISFVDHGVKHIYRIKTDGKGIWVLTTVEKTPLFYVENPGTDQYKIIPVPEKYGINFSRLCSEEEEGYLYGVGFRIKYSGGNEFEYEPLPQLSYHNLRNIHGIINIADTKYIFSENVRIKDEAIHKKEFRWSELPKAEKPKTYGTKDVVATETGAILLTLGSNKKDRLYLSTYLTGYLLSVDLDFKHKPDLLKDNKEIRIMAQSDIIGSFPDKTGRIFFGFYDGFMNSAQFMIYNPNTSGSKKWITKSLPSINEQLIARITSSCFDDLGNIYLGTGEKTITANTPTAKIFIMDYAQTFNEDESSLHKQIEINWPAETTLKPPVRILSLLYNRRSLYVIGYSPFKSTILNSFFRINLDNFQVDILNKFDESFASMGGNYLLLDDGRLLVAMGRKIYVYDLQKFDINFPVKEIILGEDDNKIRDLEKHQHNYYACLDNEIIKIDQDLKISTFENIGIEDKFISIEIVKDYLVAATRNGLLIKHAFIDN